MSATGTSLARPLLVLLGCGVLPLLSMAAVDFQRQVQPILFQHCQKCHGPDEQKSQLRLDSPAGILRGGDSGEPVFISGRSAESHLIRLVTGANPAEVMPPEGPRLPVADIELLKAWIDEGAIMPEVDPGAITPPATRHWSFQPLHRPPAPALDHPFVASEIDAFVLERLQREGLKPSPPAERETLIRRLHLVMHGLPPAPEEVDRFMRDTRPDAYARLVDRVLASPRYGERWARHWLDVARHADSNGFETNRERKSAYRYRDYVIAAFNEDKPYGRFIQEQIAGDALGVDAATGFLVAGPHDIVKSPDPGLTLMQRQNELDDMINTTGTAFLGLTLGCARCHNHKFDPISQKDYYALQAVFAGVQHGERPLRRELSETEAAELARLRAMQAEQNLALDDYRALSARRTGGTNPSDFRPPVNARFNEELFAPVAARALRFTILAASSGEPCLDELEVFTTDGTNVALADTGATATASGTLPGYEIHQLKHLHDGRHGNSRSWISDTPGRGWVRIDFARAQTISRVVWSRDREEVFRDRVPTRYLVEVSSDLEHWTKVAGSDDREPFKGTVDPDEFLARLTAGERAVVAELRERIQQAQARIDELSGSQPAWAGTFSQPEATHRLYRGDPFAKREVVSPDIPGVFGSLGMSGDEPEQQRRAKLAAWLARPDNPLTARVLVNRIWHYIFGSGIVPTPSDFGGNGVPPTHPELLDWLADEFVQGGGSIKHIQRLILNSNTFRQSSRPQPDGLARDAGGSLLWRFPPRRLEAEALRDCILAVSGALDLRMGGPGFYLHDVQVENVMHYFPKEVVGPPEFRRMIYLFKIRQEQDAIFGAFDCPDGNQVMPQRSRSNTPLQALNLFNSPFVLQQSSFLAARLQTDMGDDANRQVVRAFRLAFARGPDAFEARASAALIASEGLEAFCRALYNTSEFLFVF